MPYDLVDEVIEKRKIEQEAKRLETLSRLENLLSDLSSKYGFSKAYIFGSVVKNGKFRYESDIDVAVFDLKNEDFFQLMADLSNSLEHDVDLYQMEEVDEHLRKTIEETGLLWIREG